MSRYLYKLIGSLLLAITSPIVQAEDTEVIGLHYGEVLYHFYQDDYFTSLSHLMAAQDKNQIVNRIKEAELLQGGLQLSYGMSNEADKQFRNILDQDVDSKTQNQIWYYLGKYAYQQGEFENAHTHLNKTNDTKDVSDRDTQLLLKANTLMMLEKNNEAANLLAKTSRSEPLSNYLLINKGIAQLRAGHISAGEKTLASFNRKKLREEELKSLRDQANLGLGFQFIRQQEPQQAIKYLHEVRLNGPFSQEALLATGWALAEQDKYQDALTPWLELGQRASFDTAVQEANLAIPYAYEKLENNALAINYYNHAIKYFLKEHEVLIDAINEVNNGDWKTVVSKVSNEQFGNWITGYNDLDTVPAKKYLTNLLSGHTFQAALGTYRDLSFIENQIDLWEQSISSFRDMLKNRDDAYQEKVPATQQRIDKNETQLLSDQLLSLEKDYKNISNSNNILGLASDKELQQWNTINELENRISKLPATDKTNRQKEKLKWLKGVLYWQINEQYSSRLWSIRKNLNAIKKETDKAAEQSMKVKTALATTSNDFSKYDLKIASIKQRILDMKPALTDALSIAGKQLETLVLDQLQSRESRLTSYLTQARYSLARNHDLLSGDTP